jgi:hypothetical protein
MGIIKSIPASFERIAYIMYTISFVGSGVKSWKKSL